MPATMVCACGVIHYVPHASGDRALSVRFSRAYVHLQLALDAHSISVELQIGASLRPAPCYVMLPGEVGATASTPVVLPDYLVLRQQLVSKLGVYLQLVLKEAVRAQRPPHDEHATRL